MRFWRPLTKAQRPGVGIPSFRSAFLSAFRTRPISHKRLTLGRKPAGRFAAAETHRRTFSDTNCLPERGLWFISAKWQASGFSTGPANGFAGWEADRPLSGVEAVKLPSFSRRTEAQPSRSTMSQLAMSTAELVPGTNFAISRERFAFAKARTLSLSFNASP